MFTYEELCTPAKIYIVLSIFSILFALLRKMSLSITVFKVFFALLWTFMLNYLCDKGFETVSWIILLSPFILFWSILAVFSVVTKLKRK